MEEAARGDHGTDIFVGVNDELGSVVLVVGVAGQVGAEGFEGDSGDAHFVFEQAFSKVGDDEVDLVPGDEELVEEADGVAGT